MNIALISCSKEKKNYACPAHELYSASTLFSLSYQYAKEHTDKIYILSAKYGLVDENRILEPYDQTLSEMNRTEQLVWADRVLQDLQRECRLESDHFIILAGNNYSKDLIPFLPNHSLPLDGLRMGERMARLRQLLSAEGTSSFRREIPIRETVTSYQTDTNPFTPMAERLHKLFCSMPRYTGDQINDIPFLNGIYIIFEKGEQYYEMDRIVRVGTHTSPDRLKVRLLDHFVRENHDGSIFRKNIGKAILNAYHDPYLTVWTMDTSKPENRRYMDPVKNAETERRVTKFLHENFTFTVFQVPEKDERLRMEEAIIAALNADPIFRPSLKWSGLYSPDHEIRESGLWLKQGLDGRPITEEEFRRLLELCSKRSPISSLPFSKPSRPSAYERKQPSLQSSGEYRGKYKPLFDFLKKQTGDRVSLTFAELEELLGFPLPNSAYTYTVWWTSSSGHTQCQSWLKAGFDAVNPGEIIRTKVVTFQRI